MIYIFIYSHAYTCKYISIWARTHIYSYFSHSWKFSPPPLPPGTRATPAATPAATCFFRAPCAVTPQDLLAGRSPV